LADLIVIACVFCSNCLHLDFVQNAEPEFGKPTI